MSEVAIDDSDLPPPDCSFSSTSYDICIPWLTLDHRRLPLRVDGWLNPSASE
jgi:hypothetical protein